MKIYKAHLRISENELWYQKCDNTKNRMWLSDMTLSQRAKHRTTCRVYDSIYIKFKSRQNRSMVFRVVHMGEQTLKKQGMVTMAVRETAPPGGGGSFWGADRIALLIWGWHGCLLYHCLLNCIIFILHTSQCICYVSQQSFKVFCTVWILFKDCTNVLYMQFYEKDIHWSLSCLIFKDSLSKDLED